MKKSTLSFVAALSLAAVTFTSCNNCCQSVKELNTDADSLVYAFGVLTGSDVAGGIQRLDQPVDTDQFLKGLCESLKSDSAAFSYEVGYSFGSGLKQQLKQMSEQLDVEVNNDILIAAIYSVLNNDTNMLMNQMQAQMTFRTKAMAAEEKKLANSEESRQNKADADAYMAEKAKEEGIVKTESGLLYKVIKAGKGASPKVGDKVKVNYKGTLVDGTQFDANDDVQMVIGQMVPGFNEALMLMAPGAKYTVYIPADLGYGVRGRGQIPSNAVMIFDIELKSIVK